MASPDALGKLARLCELGLELLGALQIPLEAKTDQSACVGTTASTGRVAAYDHPGMSPEAPKRAGPAAID